MKRPPRYIDIMINTEIRFDTHRLLKFIRESNEYDLNANQITQSIDELRKNRDNVNQLLHEDIFTKRFKQACYIIMDKDEKKQKK